MNVTALTFLLSVTTFLLDKSGHECKNCMMASENQILADLISFVKQLGKRKILLVGKPGKPKKSNTFYFTGTILRFQNVLHCPESGNTFKPSTVPTSLSLVFVVPSQL